MHVRRCDICKKEVEKDNMVKAGFGLYDFRDFCLKCGKPIFDFLKKYKLLSNEGK